MNDDIQTPIGIGTIIGTTPDRSRILVMHTRPKEERTKDKGATYIRWWDWNHEKGEIVERDITGDTENTTEDG